MHPTLSLFVGISSLIVVVISFRSLSKKNQKSSLQHFVGEQFKEATCKTLRCGSRKSPLAMVQTVWVSTFLTRINPTLKITVLEGVDTNADKTLNVSLKSLVQVEVNSSTTTTSNAKPSPGLFTKELEQGLFSNMYDFCVHSLKDVPTTLPEGLAIAAICEREDPRDCVVFPVNSTMVRLDQLPEGSIVGTSSVRREALLRRDYPHLSIKLIRGNVQTRLAKLDEGEYSAILLAMAGLLRLKLKRVIQPLDPVSFPYGVSQGSLGIECRADNRGLQAVLHTIAHESSEQRCLAERALLRELEGGCQVPLGVSTRVFGHGQLEIYCEILSLDGRITVSGSLQGEAKHCEKLGLALAQQLRDQFGGEHLIRTANETWETISRPTKRPITFGSAENPQRTLQTTAA